MNNAIKITAIPAFKDNYIWLLQQNNVAYVVDPGDATPVIHYLQHAQLQLQGILLTHHHADHCGGVDELSQLFHLKIYGPKSAAMPWVNYFVEDNSEFSIFDIPVSVITVPGHTLDHLAYRIDNNLFCGDTLFAGGCGRLFEGTAPQLFNSLQKINALPEQTKIYCAHEYTESNLKFAVAIEPDNAELIARYHHVQMQRKNNIITIPSTLQTERMTNPFLRCHIATIIHSAQQYIKNDLTDPISVFAAVRAWKNEWR